MRAYHAARAHIVTAPQLRVLQAIHAFRREHEYAPTMEELRQMLGFASVTSVFKHVDNLCKKGLLTRQVATTRSLVLTDRGNAAAAPLGSQATFSSNTPR